MDDPTELALITLYHSLDPANFDLTQLGDAAAVDAMSQEPHDTLPGLTAAVDLETRRGRYAANLAYVLGVRFIDAGGSLDPALNELGAKIVDRFGSSDPEGQGEPAFRDAVQRLIADAAVTQDVVDFFTTAFEGKVQFSFDIPSQKWEFFGPATETATMLVELASMGMNCRMREGTVVVGDQDVEVLVVECEICTQAPWDRTKVGVDPRNWPVYNPGFFQDVDVLVSSASGGASWTGVIQEAVGALVTGTPIVTNLSVSYFEDKGVAVTTYDLAPDTTTLKADDGTVKIDYGFFSVAEEGVHRRIKLLKVLRIEGLTMPAWIGPLWAHQQEMIGWWFAP